MENSATVNTCATCKHWSGKSAALPVGFGMCFKAKPYSTDQKFMASALTTNSDFGCNQWKEKPRPKDEPLKVEKFKSDQEAARDNLLLMIFMGEDIKQTDKHITNYHRSWDLLMPVINKCLALVLMFEMNKQHQQDETYNFVRAAIGSALKRSDVDFQVRITSNYLKVVDFVGWYNTIKKP